MTTLVKLQETNAELRQRIHGLAESDVSKPGQFNEWRDQFDSNQKQIDELTAAMKWDATQPAPGAGGDTSVSGEAIQAVNNWMRTGMFDGQQMAQITIAPKNRQAIQSIGTDADGGFLVDDSMASMLLWGLKYSGDLRNMANVTRAPKGAPQDQPRISGASQEGSQVDENVKVTKQDVPIGNVRWGAYKFSSNEVLISQELMEDTDPAFAPSNWVPMQLVRRLARVENKRFVSGNGTTQPEGIFVSAQTGVTAAANALTADNLIDLQHSVDVAYRENDEGLGALGVSDGYISAGTVCWVMHDLTLAAIRKIKDQDGQFILRPGLEMDAPKILLGKPVLINNNVDTIGTGKKSVLFGNGGHYGIRDVRELRMRRLDELYSEYDQVGFLAFHRCDARSIGEVDGTGNAEAYKVLAHA